ncbi:MAG: SdrD B-like domain-containing protein [Chloroflexota bacterium]
MPIHKNIHSIRAIVYALVLFLFLTGLIPPPAFTHLARTVVTIPFNLIGHQGSGSMNRGNIAHAATDDNLWVHGAAGVDECNTPTPWTGSLYHSGLDQLIPDVRGIDWLAESSGIFEGLGPIGTPLIAGTTFTLRYQSTLIGVTSPEAAPVPFPGLSTAFEYTIVAEIPMIVVADNTIAGFQTLIMATEPGGQFHIFHDTTSNAVVGTGIGFDDGGTLVASGTFTAGQLVNFTYNSGNGTGNGGFNFTQSSITFLNPAFIDPTTNVTGFQLEGTVNYPANEATTTAFFDGRAGEGRLVPYEVSPDDLQIKIDTSSNFLECLSRFGDRVWIESDDDGNANTGDITPVAGMIITATRNTLAGTEILTTTTNASGYYSFTVLADTYTVTYGSVPASYGTVVPSATPGGSSESGMAGSYQEAGNPDQSHTNGTIVTVGVGEENWHVDFAFNEPPARFGDRVWIESDTDGSANTGDLTPIVGMVITATRATQDGPEIFTTTTNAMGYYSFTVPADTYTVTYGSTPANYGTLVPSATPGGNSESGNAGSYQEANNPDQSHSNGTTLTVAPAEENWHIDFAFNVPPAQFGDRVWIESDADGNANTGDITPVAGMVITATATTQDGPQVYTTTTNVGGYYSFTVPANSYVVTYGTVPESYGPFIPSATPGGSGETGNAGLYQEAGNPDQSHSNGTIVTVAAGEANWHVDFAFTPAIYDLALIKTLVSTGPFAAGDAVIYRITVVNQGNLDAANIGVIDYVPSNMNYTGSFVASISTTAQGNPVNISDDGNGLFTLDALLAGDQVAFNLALSIDANFQGTSITNWAEIDDDNGLDQDSTPDNANQNQPGEEDGQWVDNDLDSTDPDNNGTPDEDDHDPENITVEQVYDLALIKTLVSSGPFAPGDAVIFRITVVNQGTLDATDIGITDYIPDGMSYTGSSVESVSTTSNDNPVNISDDGNGLFTINSLIDGDQVAFDIVLTIDDTFQGTSLTNWVEIDEDNGLDHDSTPDNTNQNQLGEGDGEWVDNDLDSTDPDNNGTPDEDDHDPENIPVEQVYDLALIKTLVSSGPFVPGDAVTFRITVVNQGTLNAANIGITDYVPADMRYSESNVASVPATANGNLVSISDSGNGSFTIDALAAGDQVEFDVTLTINATFQGLSITNWAEINEDDGDDQDSTPDSTNQNQPGEEDGEWTDNDLGSTDPNNNSIPDEDDHDPETIAVEQVFDLALIKRLTSSGPFSPGDEVTFGITVFNQGTVDALTIRVIDYLPLGMTLSPNDRNGWIDNGDGTVTSPTIALLLAGRSTTLNILVAIGSNIQGVTLTNYAEISEVTNVAQLLDIDSIPDTDPDNDGTIKDNVITESWLRSADDNDQDDHDPAFIEIPAPTALKVIEEPFEEEQQESFLFFPIIMSQ